MKGENTFLEVPATPEQVLAIFRDWQRLEWGHPLDAEQILSFKTTVKAWRDDCELQGWQQLGGSLNRFFGTAFSKEDWQGVMKPEKQKTLNGVCALIATRVALPKIGESNIFGKRCKSASAFFALRSNLERAGVDVARVRPSTKLDQCLRLHSQAVIETITKLAPGKLPQVTTKLNLGHRLSGWACLAGLLILVLGGMSGKPEWTVAGCLILAFAFIAMTVFSNLPPARFRLEGLETFGDLSRLIAGFESEPAKR